VIGQLDVEQALRIRVLVQHPEPPAADHEVLDRLALRAHAANDRRAAGVGPQRVRADHQDGHFAADLLKSRNEHDRKAERLKGLLRTSQRIVKENRRLDPIYRNAGGCGETGRRLPGVDCLEHPAPVALDLESPLHDTPREYLSPIDVLHPSHAQLNVHDVMLSRPEGEPFLALGVRLVRLRSPQRPFQPQLRRLQDVVEDRQAPCYRLVDVKARIVFQRIRGDGLIRLLMRFVERVGVVQRPAFDNRPGRDAADLQVPVAEDLHLPRLGLGQVAVAVVVLIGLVAEKDGVPRGVARGDPEELADVERLVLLPHELLFSVEKHVRDRGRLFQPPGLVGPAGEIGILVRVVDADHVRHAAGVAVGFVENRPRGVVLLHEPAHAHQVPLRQRGVVQPPAQELVLQAPHHDRGPVLVAIDHGTQVPGVVVPEDRVVDAVRVVVVPHGPFGDHQQAHLVGHLVMQAGPGLGVRAERHGVHPLHGLPLLADFFARHGAVGRPPGSGQQIDSRTVQEKPMALGPELAEPEPRAKLVAGGKRRAQVEQVRIDVRPQRRIGPRLPERGRGRLLRRDLQSCGRELQYVLALVLNRRAKLHLHVGPGLVGQRIVDHQLLAADRGLDE